MRYEITSRVEVPDADRSELAWQLVHDALADTFGADAVAVDEPQQIEEFGE